MKVQLSYPYTAKDGKNHRAETTLDLPEQEARDLVHFGRARWPQPDKPAAEPANTKEK